MDFLSWQVYSFALKNKLVAPKQKILISVSGGIDSVALLRILLQFLEKIELYYSIIHFDHCIRKDSGKDKEFVNALARKHNLLCYSFTNSNLEGEKGFQVKARNWRMAQIEKIKKEENFDKVALGHQLNDLVETQIWKITRGCSLFDIVGMLPQERYFIRPLLYHSRQTLQQYLIKIKQRWVEDTSNKEIKYKRNFIRHKVLPVLEETSGNKFLQKMQSLHQESQQLNNLYRKNINCFKRDYLPYKYILNNEPIFAKRLIYDFILFQVAPNVLKNQINDIYRLIMEKKGGWHIDLTKNFYSYGKQQKLYVCKK